MEPKAGAADVAGVPNAVGGAAAPKVGFAGVLNKKPLSIHIFWL